MADITQHRNAHHSEVNMHEVKGFLSASKGYSYSKNIQGASEWERNFRRPNAKALIFGYEAPTTENDGDVYSITAPEIDINGILHQSGTTVRFTFSAGYDSTLYATGSYFQVSGETGEAIHNGVWLITTVNASYLEVTNSGVTDNTQDVASSSPAVGYVTHEDYDPESLSNSQSIPRIGMVRFFDTQDLWFGDAFQNGDEYYNEATGIKDLFNGTEVSTASIVLKAEVELSAAQLRAGTKVEIVAAPPAGYAIEVKSMAVDFTYNGIIYDVGTIIKLVIDNAAIYQFQSQSILDKSTSIFTSGYAAYTTNTNYVGGEKLKVFADAASTVGNGTAKIYITYRLIKL